VFGVNLTGMEWAEVGMRYGGGTLPNLNYTVPRKADVAYLSATGFKRSRLPIKWEMLQPMLFDTNANAAARAAIGEPGAFNARYESYITGVLDAHAAAGAKCIIDLHNYCRYRDFVYQPDGSVSGLKTEPNPTIYAYTTNSSQVFTRISALAAGATLKQAHLVDFWTRAANKWRNHPGFGGYGLMNEPYRLPAPGTTVESMDNQDLTIWPAYAQAAINAIRAIDPVNPIYLGGNEWSGAMSLATKNPSWPLAGGNLIYEVHMYLDAGSSGQRYDFDEEVALGFNAGFGPGAINLNTGVDRLKLAVDWAQPRGIKLALTETGMPIDDPRWQEMFTRLLNYAKANHVDVYDWHGGNHWSLHNAAINHVPGWHQNKTLEPIVSGVMKSVAGVAQADLFDDGPGWAPSGTAVTITVYARGYLAAPVTINIATTSGSLNKSAVTLAAGANSEATYTLTSAPNAIATLTYSTGSGMAVPPPRKVYSLTDPVQYAATSLTDAARALIAKYSACKWEMADGYTDYMLGGPSGEGQPIRAVADSGYGSSPGNAMEMINWLNTDSPAMGSMTPPLMRTANGRKSSDHGASDTWGLWCRKTVPFPEVQPDPRNVTPYTTGDAHFIVAAVSVPGTANSGIVFQSSYSGHLNTSEVRFSNSQPQAICVDRDGISVTLTSPTRLAAEIPAVVTFTSVPGAQRLRVNSAVVGSGSATFANHPCDQMLIGFGFTTYFPRDPFNGKVYSVVTGKGAPTSQELAVIEKYLASTAGVTL